MTIEFYARLPLHGETLYIPGDNRNRGDWNRSPAESTGAVSNFAIGDDFTYGDYLSQVARAAEINGFSGALVVNAQFGEEPWIAASALIRETKRLKFVTAFHPNYFSPWQATHMAASFQRFSGGRLVWNIIQGGVDAAQRAIGEQRPHDERYERADEFLQVVKGFWSSDSFKFNGRYYQVDGGGLRDPLRRAPLPLICSAGASDAAKNLAARHSDYYLVLAEDPAIVKQNLDDVRARAKAFGRHDIRFGMSVDVIVRETDELAYAEAERVFNEGVRAGVVQQVAEFSKHASDSNRERYKRYHGKEVKSYQDLFIAPNLWGGFGYVGIPPGFAFVGSYESVARQIENFANLGIEWFFINGYPHLEEIYRLGEYVLPKFRARIKPHVSNEQVIPLIASSGFAARGNS